MARNKVVKASKKGGKPNGAGQRISFKGGAYEDFEFGFIDTTKKSKPGKRFVSLGNSLVSVELFIILTFGIVNEGICFLGRRPLHENMGVTQVRRQAQESIGSFELGSSVS